MRSDFPTAARVCVRVKRRARAAVEKSSTPHTQKFGYFPARYPSGWTRPNLEAAVQQHLAKEKEAAAAEAKLKAMRSSAEAQLSAQRGDANVLEFKGIALGLDLATIQATGRYSCSDPKSPIADMACSLKYGERETIAGAPVRVLSLFFYGDKLHSISIAFNEKDFSSVSSALVEKYGESQVKSETVQNRMGASFENKMLTWTKIGGTVEARRYSGQLDTSSVRWLSDSYIKEFALRRKSTTKSTAKDL